MMLCVTCGTTDADEDEAPPAPSENAADLSVPGEEVSNIAMS